VLVLGCWCFGKSRVIFISAGLRNSSQNRSFIFSMNISAGWFQSRATVCIYFSRLWGFGL